MHINKRTIVILGGARDYHAMDWYRAVRQALPGQKVIFLVDLIAGEGYEKIIKCDDNIHTLFVIDNLLLSKVSRLANIWRNIVKLVVLPLQAYLLRSFLSKHKDVVVHAHPMYYMLICYLAGVKYCGTPQGSEILVRAQNSFIYRYFTKRILKNAQHITVDSFSMSKKIFDISGVKSKIVQNGIDIESIRSITGLKQKSNEVLSIRGITKLYRIEEIITSRDQSMTKSPLVFIYPFVDQNYYDKVKYMSSVKDKFIGRLDKEKMFELLKSSKLVISIPFSDSSPRSVYEAIFSGCCVAVTYNQWIDVLPKCMLERLFIVNLESKTWFDDAVSYSNKILQIPYLPSNRAIEMFDQYLSIGKIAHEIYEC